MLKFSASVLSGETPVNEGAACYAHVPAPTSRFDRSTIDCSRRSLYLGQFSQLPFWNSRRLAMRRASAGSKAVQRAQRPAPTVSSLCEGMPRQPATSSMSEVHSSAPLGHLDMPPASFRLTEHEQVSSAVSLVLVVISFHPPGLAPMDGLRDLDVSSKQTTGWSGRSLHVGRAASSPLTSGMHHSFLPRPFF